ncbi:MAG: Na+/H+ antiporter NhaC family protein [Eubacteriales bacterium]|nr:Na+/H+ antiporter NhaC family protein [Eubacteriales bacterium]
MIELLAIAIFILGLIFCLILNINIIYALIFGFIIFVLYALIKKYSYKQIIEMSISGLKVIYKLLFTFILIGILTSAWRASGTIQTIVTYSLNLIKPQFFIIITFFLCSLMSFLIGTSLGTGATMGVICATMAESMGIPKYIVTGAIISGCFFGDRCSPVSTSAQLVATITNTNQYDNIKLMFKSAFVPFIITSIIYYILGYKYSSIESDLYIKKMFLENFNINIICLIPAIIIIILSICKMNVRVSITISIIASIVIAIFVQGSSVNKLINDLIFGYINPNKSISTLVDGGGAISMIRMIIVVGISSLYTGFFNKTNLIMGIKNKIKILANRTTFFFAMLVVTIISSIISCNQTLTVMLTNEIMKDFEDINKTKRAIMIEDSAILIPGLVPYSVAVSPIIIATKANSFSIPFAFYLYIIPLYVLLKSFIIKFIERNKNTLTKKIL